MCCSIATCMSWSWEAAPSLECAMFGSYAAPASNRSATSGVVYRQEHQPSEIAGIKGFNYVPSWAVNDIDMWRDYNAPIVERDMAIAATVGFNFARVFLNYVVWSAQRSTFLKNLNHFVKTAHANGIATMPVALDLCWFGCRTPPNFNVSATGKCWYVVCEHLSRLTLLLFLSFSYLRTLMGAFFVSPKTLRETERPLISSFSLARVPFFLPMHSALSIDRCMPLPCATLT